MTEQMEELWWSDLETGNPYDDKGRMELEESFGIVFDETQCARGRQCCNPPSWADVPQGRFVGPGLGEDENGYPTGTFTTCWYFASAPTYQFCEDCVSIFEDDLTGFRVAEIITFDDGDTQWEITQQREGFWVTERVFDWRENDLTHERSQGTFDTFGDAVQWIEDIKAEREGGDV